MKDWFLANTNVVVSSDALFFLVLVAEGSCTVPL